MESGKTERVYRRIAKFAEKVHGKRNLDQKNENRQQIFRTFMTFAENKMNVQFRDQTKLKIMYATANTENILETRV